jgi:uncharacterized protein (UPF0305 family)
MTIDEIKQTAKRYAETAIKSEDDFLKAYDKDAKNRDWAAEEWQTIVKLMEVYLPFLRGEISQEETVRQQREVLKEWR